MAARRASPRQFGPSFKETLGRFAQTVVLELYPHPTTFVVAEKDIQFLIESRVRWPT